MYELQGEGEKIPPLVLGHLPGIGVEGIRISDNASGAHEYFPLTEEERERYRDKLCTCYPSAAALAALRIS